MAYSIPVVSYTGTDPDPVEWANNFVKPAIDDLDARVAGHGLWPYKGSDVLSPWGYSTDPETGVVPDQSVWGCLTRIDRPCSLLYAKAFVSVASSVGGATVDFVIYNASTLALVGTFGSAAVDSSGFKQVTPGTVITIAAPGWHLIGMRPRTATTGLTMRAFRQRGTGQPLASWGDFDYGTEAHLTWDVAGTAAAPASLVSYTRSTGGRATHAPLFAVGVAP